MEAGLEAVLTWIAEEPATAWSLLVEARCAPPESQRRYLDAITRITTMLHVTVPAEVVRSETMEESLVGGVPRPLWPAPRRAGGTGTRPAGQLGLFRRGPLISSESP